MQWENAKENVMNKRIFTAALATSALLWSAGLASAQSPGTAAEARTMLGNAAAALKANEATALAAFNDKSNTSSTTAIFTCSATT
jgi:hypothetical protein